MGSDVFFLNRASASAIFGTKRKLMVVPTMRELGRRAATLPRLPRLPAFGLLFAVFLWSASALAATYSVAGFSDTAVVTGLSAPTDFAFTPDGRILILEKVGRVLVAGVGGGVTSVALDMSASVDDGFEKGLLGICLHPSFASTGWIYLYYTANGPKNRISRFTLVGNTISPASELIPIVLDNISAQNGNHNGGTIAIGPDGKLWAAPGDSGTGGAKAQNLSPYPYEGAFSGKVLRMELDGSPAAGNPFLGDATKEPRIWAWGFRNPFRFSFRPSNGSLYVADVGSSGAQDREELNVVVAGGDYGWPDAEGTTIYNPPCTGCLPPVFDYPRATGTTIIGGVFVTGNAYPPFLRGKYVFGDNGASWIRYLEFDANDALVGSLQNLAAAAEGPVAFHLGPDGYVYYAAINTGRIFRIQFGKNFHTVTPCRVFDTRDPAGPWGGPRLAAGADRTFVVGGRCGVPATARAVSVNVTVTEPTDFGFLTLFPPGGIVPLASTINFRPGQTRANNAAVTLGAASDLVVRAGMASGGVHVLLDVSGYFDD
jgi:glucose/arabinose dehydrogenase